MNKEILDKINEVGVSIVIGARNEFPNVAMTIANLMEDMYQSGITKWEIILMDNGSEDDTSRFFAWKPVNKGTGGAYGYLGSRWAYEYSPRGLVNEDRLRIFFDPVLSNVGTRNKGVLRARYDYIVFSDAHITVRANTVFSIVDTLIKYGGAVHAPISWMGASSNDPHAGMQYSYKVGEKIWGTWITTQVSEDPFFIPLCGHAFIGVVKKEFLELGGYPPTQRVYGGGEPYLDTLYWMMGSHAMMDPRALVYHLSAGRGYSWNNNDLIYNMFLVSYILGGQRWADRILITYLNKGGIDSMYLKHLYNTALVDGEERRAWLDSNKKIGFDELLGLDKEHLLDDMSQEDRKKQDWYCTRCTKRGYADHHVMREWDRKNDALHGTHRSFVQEFRLRKDANGDIFIGNTHIVSSQALEVASKYF